eukprot:4428955-Amphidinium_carterae.1
MMTSRDMRRHTPNHRAKKTHGKLGRSQTRQQGEPRLEMAVMSGLRGAGAGSTSLRDLVLLSWTWGQGAPCLEPG